MLYAKLESGKKKGKRLDAFIHNGGERTGAGRDGTSSTETGLISGLKGDRHETGTHQS